jgi:hypothetical protein
MNEERQAVVKAVLDGVMSADALTMDELVYIENLVNELIGEKILQKSLDEGKIVFIGVENGVLN